MATLLQGILGNVTGKVGNVVGAMWKGINYVKGYAIPANPQSVAQTAQRAKYTGCLSLAQGLLPTLITTYWNPFAVKMSGFNKFMSEALTNCSALGLMNTNVRMSLGSLEGSTISSSTYNTANGDCSVAYSTTINGNGLATDYAGLVVIDKTDNSIVCLDFGSADRADAVIEPTGLTGKTATNLIAYLFFYRGTGETFVVSDSVADEMVST